MIGLDVLTPKQLAKRWKVSVGHLANMRCKRKWNRTPRWFRLGHLIRYRLADVMLFESNRTVR